MPTPRPTAIGRELRTIRKSLSLIARALARLTPALTAAVANGTVRPEEHRRRRLRLSAARLADLRLQGEYIGRLRSLKPRQKTRVKALRAAKGVRAAINLAKRLTK